MDRTGLTMSLFGSEVSGWLAWGGLPVGVATLALLIAGPEPRLATRWAWFWLFGLDAPLGALVVLGYFILGGPTFKFSGVCPGSGRLTGGWAFLLAVLSSGVLAAAAGLSAD